MRWLLRVLPVPATRPITSRHHILMARTPTKTHLGILGLPCTACHPPPPCQNLRLSQNYWRRSEDLRYCVNYRLPHWTLLFLDLILRLPSEASYASQEPPRTSQEPPRNLRGPPRNLRGTSQDFRGPPGNFRGPPRSLPRPRNLPGPPRTSQEPPRTSQEPPRNLPGAPRHLRGPPRDLRGPPRDLRGPPRNLRGTSEDRWIAGSMVPTGRGGGPP